MISCKVADHINLKDGKFYAKVTGDEIVDIKYINDMLRTITEAEAMEGARVRKWCPAAQREMNRLVEDEERRVRRECLAMLRGGVIFEGVSRGGDIVTFLQISK